MFAPIKTSIDARATAPPILLPTTDDDGSVSSQPLSTKSCEEIVSTPPGWRRNPDLAVVYDAPLLANKRRIPVPAGISKRDPGTPTPLALPPRTELVSVFNGTLPVM